MTDCPFCSYVGGSFDQALIAYQDDSTLVVPSRHQRPGNRGHCLVATRHHVGAIYTLDDAAAASVFVVVRSAAIATKQAFHADGISIRQNNDAAADQDVFHFHVHVIPRYANDTDDAYEIVPEAVRIDQARALRACWPRATA